MTQPSPRALLALAASVVALAALTSCSAPSPAPTDTVTSATPTETAAAALVIPECDVLLPDDALAAVVGEGGAYVGALDAAEVAELAPEEPIAAVLTGAETSRSCVWGVGGTDAVALAWIAEVSDDDAMDVTATAADAGYTTTMLDGAQLASRTETEGFGHRYDVLQLGPLLIAGRDLSEDGFSRILAALREANPSLPAAP